jgi:hypothetical protein
VLNRKKGRDSASPQERDIIRLPLTTVPFLRLPFYSTLHLVFGKAFFNASYAVVRRCRAPISYVFHLVDLTDPERDGLSTQFRFLPSRIPLEKKIDRMRHILGRLSQDRTNITAEELSEKFRIV